MPHSTRDPLSEPFPVGRGFSQSTPIRSPWLMLAVGILVESLAVFLLAWITVAYTSGNAGNLSLGALIVGGLFLVALPLPILLIGIARVRWMLRYRRITGEFPIPSRPGLE